MEWTRDGVRVMTEVRAGGLERGLTESVMPGRKHGVDRCCLMVQRGQLCWLGVDDRDTMPGGMGARLPALTFPPAAL